MRAPIRRSASPQTALPLLPGLADSGKVRGSRRPGAAHLGRDEEDLKAARRACLPRNRRDGEARVLGKLAQQPRNAAQRVPSAEPPGLRGKKGTQLISPRNELRPLFPSG